MYFRNYRLRRTWLEKCLKRAISCYPSIVNMLKCPKHFCNLYNSTFIVFFITLGEIKLENINLSNMRNLRAIC